MARWIWTSTEGIKRYRRALRRNYDPKEVRKLTDAQIVGMALHQAAKCEDEHLGSLKWDIPEIANKIGKINHGEVC